MCKFPLVQTGADGAVGGQDAGALFPLAYQQPGGLPDHVEDGDADLLLDAVHEVVGGVAGDGQHGAALPLQQAGAGEQPGKNRLRLPGEDGPGAVGHPSVAPDQGGHVLLVPGCIGLVQDPLVKDLGGLGAHPPQNAQALLLFHSCASCIPAGRRPIPAGGSTF